MSNPALKERLVQLLRRSADSKRLIQKFSLGRGDADDLIALARTIRVTLDIATALAEQQEFMRPQLTKPQELAATSVEGQAVGIPFNALLNRLALDGPSVLADHITDAIDEEGVTRLHRFEELETAAAAAMVKSVEDAQNTMIDGGDTPMNQVQPKSISKPQEIDFHDVWVMKKRYAN